MTLCEPHFCTSVTLGLVAASLIGCSGNSEIGRGSGGSAAIGGSTTAIENSGGSNPAGTTSGGTSNGGASASSWWKPTASAPVHWHWQLSQEFQAARDVLPNKTVFDIDGEQATAQTVSALHALSPDVRVICYFDAGVYENYRSDAASFPAAIIGNPDVGWDGSYWLDIRQLDVLMPILRSRAMNWCLNKGFDAVEPDETEVWSNNPGFPITRDENTAFNKAVADMVHSLGMSVGLKGNNSEASILEPYFDWALTEQCWQYDECAPFHDSFVAANKMVLNVEYNVDPNCTLANQWHINASRRDLNLVGPTATGYLYQPCVPDTNNSW